MHLNLLKTVLQSNSWTVNEDKIEIMDSDEFEHVIQPLEDIKEELERSVSEDTNAKPTTGENIMGKEEHLVEGQEEVDGLKEKTGEMQVNEAHT